MFPERQGELFDNNNAGRRKRHRQDSDATSSPKNSRTDSKSEFCSTGVLPEEPLRLDNAPLAAVSSSASELRSASPFSPLERILSSDTISPILSPPISDLPQTVTDSSSSTSSESSSAISSASSQSNSFSSLQSQTSSSLPTLPANYPGLLNMGWLAPTLMNINLLASLAEFTHRHIEKYKNALNALINDDAEGIYQCALSLYPAPNNPVNDEESAIRLFEKAAKKNHFASTKFLAEHYESNEPLLGRPRDIARALIYYALAASISGHEGNVGITQQLQQKIRELCAREQNTMPNPPVSQFSAMFFVPIRPYSPLSSTPPFLLPPLLPPPDLSSTPAASD